eukprot:jgi/Botrbrau1/12384/Bobra.0084s0007.1
MAPKSLRCRPQYQLFILIFQHKSHRLREYGQYAVHCTSGGDVASIGRHYSVRNGLDAVLTSARQRVTREPTVPTPVEVAVAQTSASTRWSRVATFTSTLLARHYSPLPTCSTSCRVVPPRALPKTSRPAMMSCWRVNTLLWPSKTFHSKQLGGCMLALLGGSRGYKTIP